MTKSAQIIPFLQGAPYMSAPELCSVILRSLSRQRSAPYCFTDELRGRYDDKGYLIACAKNDMRRLTNKNYMRQHIRGNLYASPQYFLITPDAFSIN